MSFLKNKPNIVIVLIIVLVFFDKLSFANAEINHKSSLNANILWKYENQSKAIVLELAEKDIFTGYFETLSPDIQIVLFNNTDSEIKINAVRSGCPCIKIIKSSKQINAKNSTAFIIKINPENYQGRIVKILSMQIETNNIVETLFLPISFIANEQEKTFDDHRKKGDVAISLSSKYLMNFAGENMQDSKYKNVEAWLFGGKNCVECNLLKQHILPSFFTKDNSIVYVNIDETPNLLLLINLEEKLKIKNPGSAPVLYYKDRIFYGADEIKKILKANEKQESK